MFAPKITILLALLAGALSLVAAGPPACLLAAIKYDHAQRQKWWKADGYGSTEPDPSDLQNICGDDASKVESQIVSLCASNADAAMKAFASTCSAAGKTIRMYLSVLQSIPPLLTTV